MGITHSQHRLTRIIINWQDTRGRRLRIVKDDQLDSLLPFLQQVPADSYPVVRHVTAIGGDAIVLYALHTEPSPESSQEATRELVRHLIWRTVERSAFKTCLQGVRPDAIKLLGELSLPIRSGALLAALCSIGAMLSRASTVGRYYEPGERPLRTPTECLVALLDALESAERKSCAGGGGGRQRAAVLQIRRRGEEARLRSRMDIESVMMILETAEDELEAVGLNKLRDEAHGLAEELRSHGTRGPPLTRLLDNVYGRAWESILNAELVADMPPKVIEAANIMAAEVSKLFSGLPADVQQTVCASFAEHIKTALPRPWSERDRRLLVFSPHSLSQRSDRNQLDSFLKQPSRSGYEAAGNYFVVLTIFDVMKRAAPNHNPWIHGARARYQSDIVPLKGRLKFEGLALSERTSGGGITLAHHAPACEGGLSVRPGLTKTWDLDRDREADDEVRGRAGDGDYRGGKTESISMRSIRHGVPYVTGISGYMHLLCSLFAHIKCGTDLDVRHAVLGLLVYLVYDGGHSWNEGLQTVKYLEAKIPLGVFEPTPLDGDVSAYVADYSEFIKFFDGTETEQYLARAVQRANEMTLMYRRRYVGRFGGAVGDVEAGG